MQQIQTLWPGMDVEIENMIKSCDACLSTLPNPLKPLVISRKNPEKPWQRIHVDYAFYALWGVFCRFGIPEILGSDNGMCFTSEKFQKFQRLNNIKHKIIAPGHPVTKNDAENGVKTIKKALKHFLFYRIPEVNTSRPLSTFRLSHYTSLFNFQMPLWIAFYLCS